MVWGRKTKRHIKILNKISAAHLFLHLIIFRAACEMNCMCACQWVLPETNQSQILPLLSFPFFLSLLFLDFSSFPVCCFFAGAAIRTICWHRLAAVMPQEEPVAHHPSSIIRSSERFRRREGGMCGRRDLLKTLRKQAGSQQLEPGNLVPKTKC